MPFGLGVRRTARRGRRGGGGGAPAPQSFALNGAYLHNPNHFATDVRRLEVRTKVMWPTTTRSADGSSGAQFVFIHNADTMLFLQGDPADSTKFLGLTFRVYSNQGGVSARVNMSHTFATPLVIGNWYEFYVDIDFVLQTAKIFLNGTQIVSQAIPYLETLRAQNPLVETSKFALMHYAGSDPSTTPPNDCRMEFGEIHTSIWDGSDKVRTLQKSITGPTATANAELANPTGWRVGTFA